MRKLIPLLLALLLMPGLANPLGLGEIRLNSALNQPFRAEIELLSVTAEEGQQVQATLAPLETFVRMGLERPAVLTRLDFQVRQRADGSYYVEVTSRQPVSEPYLNFLLEVNWPAGRIVREYTVLLDPPELFQASAPAIAAPASSAPARTAPERTAPAATVVSGTPTAARPPAAAPGTIQPVRIQRNDTLWSIAREMRPDRSITIPQMMMALLQANPDAFEANNVHRMKAGHVLRLDDPALLRAMSQAEAQRALQQQTREWQDYQQRAAAAAGQRPARAAEQAPALSVATVTGARLTLAAPEEGDAARSAEGAGVGEGAGDPTALRGDLMRALEEAEAQRQRNQHLQERLAALEEQLASMQRLLALKDDDLAVLQAQLTDEPAVAAALAPTEAAAQPETAPADIVETETVTPEPAAAVETEADAVAAPETADAAAPVEAAPVAETPRAVAPVVPDFPPFEQPSIIDQVIGGVMDTVQKGMANPVAAGAAGSALLLVLLLALVIIKRRRASQFQESMLTGDTSSMLRAKAADAQPSEETSFFSQFAVSGMTNIQSDDSEVDPLTEADVYMAYGRHKQAEELLRQAIAEEPERHELKVKLLEVFYGTKNRAAFEAQVLDVHEALNGSGELWDKVLAMGHALLPDNPLFADVPTNIQVPDAAGGTRPDSDVMDIGLDLDALAEEMESTQESSSTGDELNIDLGLDFSDLEGDTSDSGEAASAEEAMDFDLDFGSGSGDEDEAADVDLGFEADTSPADESFTSSDPAATEAEAEADFGGGLDFDTGDDTAESQVESTPESGEAAAVDESLDGLDFDLSDLESDTAGEDESASVTAGDDSTADFAAEEWQSPAPETADESVQAEETSSFDAEAGDLGDLDLSQLDDVLDAGENDADTGEAFGLDTGGEGDALADFGDLDLGDLDSFDLDSLDGEGGDQEASFGDMDEIGTKLDLAKAYVDMGDAEGARNLLDEVLNEGDDGQKQQAEQLLQQIS